MIDIPSFLTKLAQHRPIFHSEADFQHAFAWQLHQYFPDAKIRLEYPLKVEKWIYVDIWAEIENWSVAIELKYKTAYLELPHLDELFHLKNQGAQDLGRYDFLNDVQRLEQIVGHSENTVGLAIMLTNDAGYWNQSRLDTIDAAFRLNEKRIISGSLQWGEIAAPGTTKGREGIIILKGNYEANWGTYSEVSDGRRGKFCYLAFEIFGQP